MLKMTIEDWKKRIERQFEAGLSNRVTIKSGKPRDTNEITNFEYSLIPESFEEVEAPVPEEVIERSFIVNKSRMMFDKFLRNDMNSRQAAFVNNYDGCDNHCISYFHFYVRDNKLCMNVYVRSMDFKRNFVFDNQTFNLAYAKVFESMKRQFSDIQSGFIKINVFSLHIYVG